MLLHLRCLLQYFSDCKAKCVSTYECTYFLQGCHGLTPSKVSPLNPMLYMRLYVSQ